MSSWNLRDAHTAETLAFVVQHFTLLSRRSKVVVWSVLIDFTTREP